MLIVPERIVHKIEEPESIEIRTKFANLDIKIKAPSAKRVKEIADEIVRLFSPDHSFTGGDETKEIIEESQTKVVVRPRNV